jgi:hypothetical protein
MSQHLTRSLKCKAFINSAPILVHNHHSIRSAGPHAPILDTKQSCAGNESHLLDDGYNSSPNSSVNDEQVLDEEVPEPVLNDDTKLQNAVLFPCAFTNSAFHEVQLLKLLHGVGATDYAFQSIMEWGRNCL